VQKTVPVAPAAAGPYRPTLRPPVALLTVCDDGKSDGEVIRLRADRFIIGRTDGDLLIPHDALISGRHVEITRQRLGDKYRWVVTDLQTTNGLFIRVSRAALVDRAEFLVGRGRYRMELPAAVPPNTVDDLPAAGPSDSTRPWGADAPPPQHATLVEVLGPGAGARVLLTQAECWVGSDPACVVCRPDDPFVEPRHARLYRDAAGVWHAVNNKSINGLWLKAPQMTVEDGCLFQIGEQRFRLKAGV
jgi:pSer/pThr/pTyr-binding forkhead associated (FHA) protein